MCICHHIYHSAILSFCHSFILSLCLSFSFYFYFFFSPSVCLFVCAGRDLSAGQARVTSLSLQEQEQEQCVVDADAQMRSSVLDAHADMAVVSADTYATGVKPFNCRTNSRRKCEGVVFRDDFNGAWQAGWSCRTVCPRSGRFSLPFRLTLLVFLFCFLLLLCVPCQGNCAVWNGRLVLSGSGRHYGPTAVVMLPRQFNHYTVHTRQSVVHGGGGHVARYRDDVSARKRTAHHDHHVCVHLPCSRVPVVGPCFAGRVL